MRVGTWQRVSGGAVPLVSLDEAKRQCNTVDFDDDDALLTALIAVATQRLELADGILGRPLTTQRWHYLVPAPASSFDSSPYFRGHMPSTGFLLARAPLQTVVTVENMVNGSYATWPANQWQVRKMSDEASWLRPVNGAGFPVTDVDEAAWRITVDLGYGATATDVPAPIRHAALLLIGHFYANREAVAGGQALQELPMGVQALLAPYTAPHF